MSEIIGVAGCLYFAWFALALRTDGRRYTRFLAKQHDDYGPVVEGGENGNG